MKRLLLSSLDKVSWVLTHCPDIYSRRCSVGYDAQKTISDGCSTMVPHCTHKVSGLGCDGCNHLLVGWGSIELLTVLLKNEEPWLIIIPKKMAMKFAMKIAMMLIRRLGDGSEWWDAREALAHHQHGWCSACNQITTVLLLLQILCLQCQHCFCYWNMADTLLAVAHALQPIHYSAIATADTLLAVKSLLCNWMKHLLIE